MNDIVQAQPTQTRNPRGPQQSAKITHHTGTAHRKSSSSSEFIIERIEGRSCSTGSPATDLVTQKTDANGAVTRYFYDSYSRVSTVYKYPNGSTEDPNQRVNYTYDSYSNPSGTFQTQNAQGRLAAAVTNGGQFIQMYDYNSAGRVTTKGLDYIPNTPSLTGELEFMVGYTYDPWGQILTTTYPPSPDGPYSTGAVYTVGFDNMQRPASLTSKVPNGNGYLTTTLVSGASYNAANQPTTSSFDTRGYNSLNQLTSLNGFTYNYTAGSNNGQVSSTVANGTTVNYSYDKLGRLTAASTATGSSSTWSQSYQYDGFGNLTSKTGSGLNFTNNVDPTTNRLSGTGFCYDANGNMLGQNGCGTYTYDVSNRMVNAGLETYMYGADNKRLSRQYYQNGSPQQNIYVYGVNGEKLATYSSTLGFTTNAYFAGQLVSSTGWENPQGHVDRLGSVTSFSSTGGGSVTYLPYGEQFIGTAAADSISFATYTNDSSTGLYYADQRYYTSTFGRFLSADRFKRAAKANDSGSWNKYSYTRGDPVNRRDRHGAEDYCVDEYCCDDNPDGCDDEGDSGGGGIDCSQPYYSLLPACRPKPSGGGSAVVPCPPVPSHPSVGPNGAQISANIAQAQTANTAITALEGTGLIGQSDGNILRAAYLAYETAPGQPLDYKQYVNPNDPNYESLRNFGNFDFGAVAAAVGLSPVVAQWGAGAASALNIAVTNLFKYGILKGPPSSFGSPLTGPPYGDSPQEQAEIVQGYTYGLGFIHGDCK